MLKDRLPLAALVLALFVFLSPIPSQAAPWSWTAAARPAAGLFSQLASWWNVLLNGPARPARPERSDDWRKNGCVIDPNGITVCGTGTSSTQPTPTDSTDSGTN